MTDTTKDVLGALKQYVRNDIPNTMTLAEGGDTLRNAILDLNGGSDTIDPRTFRPGTELFAFVEEAITIIENEGIKGDEFFMKYVDYRNVAEGDQAVFTTIDNNPFMVSQIGRGNQAIARQRLNAYNQIEVKTIPRAVRVYEHVSRMLAGRVDFNTFIQLVAQSVQKQKYDDIYQIFLGLSKTTPGMYNEVVYSGSYSEQSVLDVIAHVEADNNAPASIIGTANALRRLQMTIMADSAKNDLYNVGYYGKFFGKDTYCIQSRYKTGTHEFIWPDNRIYIVASQDKWIKFVTEGRGYMDTRSFTENFDMTNEYWYITQYGVALLLAHAVGICDFTNTSN